MFSCCQAYLEDHTAHRKQMAMAASNYVPQASSTIRLLSLQRCDTSPAKCVSPNVLIRGTKYPERRDMTESVPFVTVAHAQVYSVRIDKNRRASAPNSPAPSETPRSLGSENLMNSEDLPP